jgi:hypothetical protein
LAPPCFTNEFEFLQAEKFSIDQILKKFVKILNAPFFFFAKQAQLEPPAGIGLPGDLLRAPLIWVHHGSILPPLQQPYDGPDVVLGHGPRSFTIQVRARDEIISVS